MTTKLPMAPLSLFLLHFTSYPHVLLFHATSYEPNHCNHYPLPDHPLQKLDWMDLFFAFTLYWFWAILKHTFSLTPKHFHSIRLDHLCLSWMHCWSIHLSNHSTFHLMPTMVLFVLSLTPNAPLSLFSVTFLFVFCLYVFFMIIGVKFNILLIVTLSLWFSWFKYSCSLFA